MADPTVHVALATYNGLPWIEAQVDSILRQQGANVCLVVSDDGSTDGTREWLEQLAASDPRVRMLPRRQGARGVGPNFLYLAGNIEVEPGQYLAFSDQDDLWQPHKLAQQIEFLRQKVADATSSNVVAFGEAGRKKLIDKAQKQQRWDFIAEAPGPGSTFLLDSRAVRMMQDGLQHLDLDDVWLHDWVIYALVRGAGGRWRIDPRPHVAYRQHAGNVLGAHRGLPAVIARWRNLRNGRYREQFLLVARGVRDQATAYGRPLTWLADLDELIAALEDPSLKGRLRLLPFLPAMRRKNADRITFGLAGLLGVW